MRTDPALRHGMKPCARSSNALRCGLGRGDRRGRGRERAGRARGHGGLVVENDQGVEMTMLLAPLDPGWAVEASSWCEPVY